ncbi:MMPL family transporter [Candidatus Uabimicrobium sp. HlEnr_7]|uniref:MMPL family transporter n=1 Tax=Candidatus Uabimicrobium helgolandensis TaxID=3095367 RepID=UPI0035574953
MQGFYNKLALLTTKRSSAIILIAIFISIIPSFLLPKLQLKTDYAELVFREAPVYQEYEKYTNNFGALKALYVIIDSPHAKKIVEATHKEILSLHDQNKKPLVKRMLFKTDKQFFYDYGLLFASKSDVANVSRRQLIELANAKNFTQFIKNIATSLKTSKEQDIPQQNYVEQILNNLNKSIVENKLYQSKLPKSKSNYDKMPGMDEDGYFILGKDRLLVRIYPTITHDDYRKYSIFFSAVKEILETEAKKYNAEISYTGSPKLVVDEMQDILKDAGLITFFSLLGVTLLFVISFQKFIWPLLSILVLAIAIIWTFGFAVVLFGYLNVVSIVFAAVLVGLGIDYGIHIVQSYHEALCNEQDNDKAIHSSVSHNGRAIITSAITTAGAFFISSFSGFKGTFQLGILGAIGILLCAIFMLVLLPALLSWSGKKNKHSYKRNRSFWIRAVHKLLRYPKTVVVVTFIMVSLGITTAFFTHFDYDLLKLHKKNSLAVSVEKEITKHGFSSRFAVVLHDKNQLESLKTLVKNLEKLPAVEKVVAITKLIPKDETEKIKMIQKVQQLFATWNAPEISSNIDIDKLIVSLEFLLEECENLLENSLSGIGGSDQKVLNFLDDIVNATEELLNTLQTQKHSKYKKIVIAYQRSLIEQFHSSVRKVKQYINVKPFSIEKLPKPIYEHFIGKNNLSAIYIYPKNNIGEEVHLREFVHQVQKVSNRVTGPLIGFYDTLTTMKEGYQQAGIMALIAIFILLLFEFKKLYIAVLTIIPLICGASLMIGLMFIFNIRINPANLVALPLIFGIGADHGIHIAHRYFREKHTNIDEIVASTGHAILITSLTTAIGFGSLSFADYQGLSSLGIMMVLGVMCCLYTSIVLLPAILKILQGKRE